MESVEIKPNRIAALGGFLVNALMFTAIGWIAVMLPVMFLLPGFSRDGLASMSPIARVLLLAITPLPGLAFGIWFAKKMVGKQYWRLTDSELASGMSFQKRYPLATIERAIVGLPQDAMGKLFQKATPGSITGTTVDALAVVDPRWSTLKNVYQERAKEENSLLLCFRDGSMLPLRLFLFPEGRVLMEQLKERLNDRLVRGHNYSPEEIRRLRRRDVNELIPAPRSSK